MITENMATDLLGRAAGTIDVPPGTSLLPPPQRRWIVPAIAAAAVTAAVIAGFALIDHDQPKTSPAPRIRSGIPSVFAYDADSAIRMLRSRGLNVTRKIEHGCSEAPDRALRTEPGPGARFTRGDTVTLVVSKIGPVDDCAVPTFLRIRAWELLDYANGRGVIPKPSPILRVSLNGKVSDLRTALRALAVVASRRYSGQSLAVEAGRKIKSCDSLPRGHGAPDLNPPTYSMSIVFQSNFPIDPVCNVTNVFLAKDGSIERIEVTVPSFITDPPDATPTPDQDGDS